MAQQRKGTTVKAASFILDYNIYPRHKIDSTHVLHIRQVLAAGEALPPVVADRESHRIVDGFHRVTATLLEFGEDATIQADLRKYANEADMFADAIRLNTGHGSNLTPWDRVRCIVVAEGLKLNVARLAEALRMTPAKLEELHVTRTARASSKITPIKRGLGHLAGRRLSKKQQAGNAAAGGYSRTYYVNEVIRTLENDLADWDNLQFAARLVVLRDLLNGLDLNALVAV